MDYIISFVDFYSSDQLGEFINHYIQEHKPNCVLFLGVGATGNSYKIKSLLSQIICDDYKILENENENKQWLIDAMHSLRNSRWAHSIVLSHFPSIFGNITAANGIPAASLPKQTQIPEVDLRPYKKGLFTKTKADMVIFWTGMTSLSYLRAVSSYIFDGVQGLAETYCLFSPTWDRSMNAKRREEIKNTEPGEKRQAVLRMISNEMEEVEWFWMGGPLQ